MFQFYIYISSEIEHIMKSVISMILHVIVLTDLKPECIGSLINSPRGA